MAIISKQSTDLMQFLLKFKCNSSLHLKYDIKFNMELQKSRTAKRILSNKKTVGGITLSNFKLNYRTIVMKTAWC